MRITAHVAAAKPSQPALEHCSMLCR
jgi:hypothetical protein